MLGNSSLPKGPLYDPKIKIKRYKFVEDFENIRLNYLKNGQLYSDPNFLYYLGDDKDWKRPKEISDHPYFINGKPDRFDALQGIVGDCWLVTAFEAIALNEQLFNHVVPPDQSFYHNYMGAFHFRIWQLGCWYDVVVDDRLPVFKENNHLCYVHSVNGNVFWAALLEKAYAKFCGKYSFGYDYLKSGAPATAYQDLTGGLVETVELSNLPRSRPLKWFINEVFSQRALLGCVFFSNVSESTGLTARHAYAVTSVFKCEDDDPDYHGLFLVRIMNPWGFEEWRGDWSDQNFELWKQIDKKIREKIKFVKLNDGEFWMNETDLVKYFEFLFVCHLGPGQYIESRRIPKIPIWSTNTFYGEWIRKISAVGAHNNNRHLNPQYKFELKAPENDTNRDGMVTVVIELTQRSKFWRRFKPNIGFYVYSLSNTGTQNPSDHLNSDFFKRNRPLNKRMDFSMTSGHAVVLPFELEPGGYCIVPCTEHPNVETQFLLRVFAESEVAIWEYDSKISKSSPSEEHNLNTDYVGLRKLFDEVAQGGEEMNWIGLREVLEIELNQNLSFLGTISSILKSFFNTVAKTLTLNPFTDNDGYIVFSKDECRSMIAMLDKDHSGKLSYTEFCDLWKKIKCWCQVFDCYKDGKEGYLTVENLQEALGSIGYNINQRTVHSLFYVYANEQGKIQLTDFILCGVTLETVLTLFQKAHVEDEHKIQLTLLEWVTNTLVL